MKLRIALFISAGFGINLYSQQIESVQLHTASPVQVIVSELPESSGMHAYNLKPIKIEHGVNEQQTIAASKNKSTIIEPVKRGNASSPEFSLPTFIDERSYQPADNAVGISDEGVVLTCNNIGIALFDSSANLIKKVSLQSFFAIPVKPVVGQLIFDPQVYFDPLRQKWVVCVDYAEYNTSNGAFNRSSSALYVAFSQTADPSGAWNVYSIPAAFTVANTVYATDFPTMAFTNSSLFILGNLSLLDNSISHQVVFQIDFNSGYSMQALQYKSIVVSSISGFVAAHHNFEGNGEILHMIRTAAFPGAMGSKHIDYLRVESVATDTLVKLSKASHLELPEFYYRKGGSPQKGNSKRLQMTGSVVRSCFYQDSMLYGVFSTVKNNKTAMYYLRIKPNFQDIDFSETYGMVIEHEQYELGYGSIQYAGIKNNRNIAAVLIVANFSSSQDYPGYGVYYVSPEGECSDYTVIKTGESYYKWYNSDTLIRWGDYTGVAKQHNRNFKFVVTGQYAMSNRSVGSHFALVSNQKALGLEVDRKSAISMYPNPVSKMEPIHFDIQTDGVYTVQMLNSEGKVIKVLDAVFLHQGKGVLDIELKGLSAGVYMVRITDCNRNSILLTDTLILE